MPELPEVETVVQGLKKANLIGNRIIETEVFLAKTVSPSNLAEKIQGQIILDIFRRAKFIVIKLKDYYLTVHLRMTGHLFLKELSHTHIKKNGKIKIKPQKHEHIFLTLDNKRMLIYEDIRKFGKFVLVKDIKPVFSKLGPEPLSEEFKFIYFFQNLKRKKIKIKPLLLNQNFIAGLGNIYANEALFLAGINPEKMAFKISKKAALKLFSAIKKTLLEGIKNKGTSLGENYLHFSDLKNTYGKHQNFLLVHDRYLQNCKICKSPIQRKKIAQRTAFFCPKCQK